MTLHALQKDNGGTILKHVLFQSVLSECRTKKAENAGEDFVGQLALADASIPAPFMLPAPDQASSLNAPVLACLIHASGYVELASSAAR